MAEKDISGNELEPNTKRKREEEVEDLEEHSVSDLFSFFKLCSKLKHLKRTGWVKHSIDTPETVAGHMYRMSLMSFLFSKEESVDYNKCVKMSLVHDLAESIVGDLTPFCGVSKEEKHKREKDAMIKISGLVPKHVGEELHSLWIEYEEGKTSEATLVNDLDKFDMILQAYEYETDQSTEGDLQQFFDSTKDIFETSTVQLWAKELLKIRQKTTESKKQ